MAVPRDLQETFGARVIMTNLRTSDLREAQRKRWYHVKEAQAKMDRLREPKGLSSGEIEQEARVAFEGILKGAEDARQRGKEQYWAAPENPPPGTMEEEDSPEVAGLELQLGLYGDAIRQNDLSLVEGEAEAVMKRSGATMAEDTPEYEELCHSLLRAHFEAFRFLLAFRRREVYEPEQPFNPSIIDPVSLKPSVSRRRTTKPRPGGGPRLEEAFAKYAAAMSVDGGWSAKTRQQSEQTFRLFVEHLGDQPVTSVTRQDVVGFRDVLAKLPKTYGKSIKDRDKPLTELIQRPGERIKPRTIKRHLTALTGFFSWAKAEGMREEGDNPASGFIFAKNKRAREERPAWSIEELKTLFSSPAWTGCKSDSRRTLPGPKITRDGLYWIPLISLYGGLRLEEAAQLHLKDVREEKGIWFFDVKAGDGRQLKGRAAVRRVPIHSALVAAGFLEYVKDLREKGADRVFPDLKRGGPDERFGFYLTKKFGRYRRAVGLSREGVDLHALRATFTTALQNADVSESLANELLGHEGATISYGRYGKGVTLGVLRDAIEKARYPGLDLGHLCGAAPK